jgi:hypothetical protein
VILAVYQQLRAGVIEAGFGEEVEWAQTVTAPTNPEALWREYAWVVINSGMRNQVAQGIWERVRPAVENGGSASEVFGHKGKTAAIDEGWRRRAQRFSTFNTLLAVQAPVDDVLAWCERLPWIGGITKWHLAKNLGVDCAKPDRWLERVAAAAGEPVPDLCARLAEESGDRIATVDLVVWRACNLGLHIPA